jgi:ribosome-binding factor A
MARVNEVLREVLADAIEAEAGTDERLELVTVTAVECDPDLRHATVLLDSLSAPAAEALGEARVRLQAAIARQVRMKRTPQLSFGADPAIEYGERVEKVLRALKGSAAAGVVPGVALDEPGASALDEPGASAGPPGASAGPPGASALDKPGASAGQPGEPAQPGEVAEGCNWSGSSGPARSL